MRMYVVSYCFRYVAKSTNSSLVDDPVDITMLARETKEGLQCPRRTGLEAFYRRLNGNGKPVPTLGMTGVLTAYYGNPRQVFLSAAMNF
jgi:hypothetical protein